MVLQLLGLIYLHKREKKGGKKAPGGEKKLKSVQRDKETSSGQERQRENEIS